MQNIKLVTILALLALAFNNCYASEKGSTSNSILDKEIFTTIEEKRELFQALGIEYTHDVIVAEELQNDLVALAQRPEAQHAFKANEGYQAHLRNQTRLQPHLDNHSITDKMIIKKISPAVGYGVIAGCFIKNDTILGLYSGQLKRSSQATCTNDYSFGCDSIVPNCPELEVDAQFKGNELRFINGSQSDPNCGSYHFRVATGEKRIIYRAIKDIQEGEQILTDYGQAYWNTPRRMSSYQELATPKKTAAKVKINEKNFGSGLKKGFFNKK